MTAESDIRDYLKALEAGKAPQPRGRRTVEFLSRRINDIQGEIDDASDPIKKVKLAQERLDLKAELDSRTAISQLDELEKAFIEHAAEVSVDQGISYNAWRDIGVPPKALKQAGIKRGSTVAVRPRGEETGTVPAEATPPPAPAAEAVVAQEPWPDPDPAQHHAHPELPPYPTA
jgi:hypothetical protein